MSAAIRIMAAFPLLLALLCAGAGAVAAEEGRMGAAEEGRAAAAVAAVELDAPKEVRDLLKRHVRLLRMEGAHIPAAGPDRLALVRRTLREVADLLATEGYFAAKVRVDRGDPTRWRLVVEPGTRAVVAAVNIVFTGEIERDDNEKTRREALRNAWTLPVGQPFRQADWEQAKQTLLDALHSERYAAAKFATTQADVDPATARVRLDAIVDSGPVFRLGALEVSGLRDLPADFIARFGTLEEGDIYRLRDLLAFQESLQAAPQLAVVVVSIDPDPQKAAAVPVRVDVTEARPQRLGFGFGASSNTGYHVETSWRDVNLFSRGWELSSGLRLEQRRQSLYADIFLPPVRARHRDSAGIGLERSDLEGLRVQTHAVGATRATKRGDIETQLAARVQHEEIRPDQAEKSQYATLTLNWGWVRRAVDDVLDPRRGHVLEIQLGGGVGLSANARNFTRGYGRYQHYFTLGKDNVLTLRGEAGATLAQTRDGVPQDFLFRAGGTQSVRGYAYRSLGVTEGTATVGGRYLATGSAELVRWIKPSTGLAVFVDSGDAADSKDSFKTHTGYGLGARWLSPAGPLAIDLAWAREEKRPRLHFGVAVAF
ncbi:MAG: autotransporter assembly complex protein TamA [Azoarcus sp.]|jgi:translocation and assembly module TamA|nr:autotransporter assembly complex protein TamA [Azoarcus sp.]